MSAVPMGLACAQFVVGAHVACPPTVAISVLFVSSHEGLRGVTVPGVPSWLVIVKLAAVRNRQLREWERKTTSVEIEASKLAAEDLGRITVNDGLAELEHG